MQYHYWDLGDQSPGTIVRVTLSGDAPNVRLLDSANYRAFQRGERHQCTGGHATRSPVQLAIPHYGHWFVVVDFGGLAGRGRAAVEIISAA